MIHVCELARPTGHHEVCVVAVRRSPEGNCYLPWIGNRRNGTHQVPTRSSFRLGALYLAKVGEIKLPSWVSGTAADGCFSRTLNDTVRWVKPLNIDSL
jgi:hypothetical protein